MMLNRTSLGTAAALAVALGLLSSATAQAGHRREVVVVAPGAYYAAPTSYVLAAPVTTVYAEPVTTAYIVRRPVVVQAAPVFVQQASVVVDYAPQSVYVPTSAVYAAPVGYAVPAARYKVIVPRQVYRFP